MAAQGGARPEPKDVSNLMAGEQTAAQPPQAAAAGARKPFVILYTRGPAWVAGKPLRDQPNFTAHGHYLTGLLDEGRLILSGPFLDEPGALAIVEAADKAEAEAIARRDPPVVDGVLSYQVYAFSISRQRK